MGFALYENLTIASAGPEWALLAAGRIGSGLLHITTGALSGWALAEAWRNRRYLLLGVTYLAVVAIHSLWNAAAVVSGVWNLNITDPLDVQMGLGLVAPAVLVALAGTMFAVLVGWNAFVRRQNNPEIRSTDGIHLTTD
jgi:hypothetical protein